ncbi:HERC2 [Symbiodinium natans]|uniref:HERC2 protein n=1 Tax=Symbiodinium natans TaxID=878477 RepID=A0A812HXY9_9DINO|nr:HERC2 [Symbiodinium natans]
MNTPRIFSSRNSEAFALVRSDGSVVTWGESARGGDCSGVQEQLYNVEEIQSNKGAFAALRGDGCVVTWGSSSFGGDSQAVQDQLQNVRQICAAYSAFAALREDGSVITWGRGGDCACVRARLKDVVRIEVSESWFAALLSDGSVVSWGPSGKAPMPAEVRGVAKIRATQMAFAGIRADGSVVTWGDRRFGGDSSAIQDELRDVQEVCGTSGTFAALRADGRVVTWGQPKGDGSHVQDQLQDVQALQATTGAFAALLGDGTVVTWGDKSMGGDSSSVREGKVMKGTAMKAKAKATSKAGEPAPSAPKDPEKEALWMCQQLSDGTMSPESLTRGYVLLRHEAKKWVNLPKVKELVSRLKQPADNWHHFMFAHVCSFMIDGILEDGKAYKVLFSDEKDTHFFSCGVEDGHFIRDGANLFREFLEDYEVRDFEAAIKGKSSDMKLLENLLVKFAHLPQETLAS